MRRDLLWASPEGWAVNFGLRSPGYIAPTWSWASLDWEIEEWTHSLKLQDRNFFMMDIISVDFSTHPADKTQTGQVFGDSLVASGVIQNAKHFKLDGCQRETVKIV
jgi:hypothetical protein